MKSQKQNMPLNLITPKRRYNKKNQDENDNPDFDQRIYTKRYNKKYKITLHTSNNLMLLQRDTKNWKEILPQHANLCALSDEVLKSFEYITIFSLIFHITKKPL